MYQGVYHNDERDGPGLLRYKDDCRDVGLWKRNRLVRICSAAPVDSPFSLSQLGYDVPARPPLSPPTTTTADGDQADRSRRDALQRCGVTVQDAAPFDYPFVPDFDELAAAVLCDFLPPSCRAADLQALDDAFVADDSASTSRKPSSDGLRSRLGSMASQYGARPPVSIPVVKEEGEEQARALADSGAGKELQASPESGTTKSDAQQLLDPGLSTDRGPNDPGTSPHRISDVKRSRVLIF